MYVTQTFFPVPSMCRGIENGDARIFRRVMASTIISCNSIAPSLYTLMVIAFLFIISKAYTLISENNNVLASYASATIIPPSFVARDSTDCLCPAATRSLLNVIWSCLTTIFLCTWVSIHPNLPPPKENRFPAILRQLHIMSWALFAPEMILMWSVRQWRFARIASRMYKGRLLVVMQFGHANVYI